MVACSALTATPAQAATGSDIAAIAHAQVGKGCSGQGWVCHPDEWCADFALWVWATAGVPTGGLDARASSFIHYGRSNNRVTNTPHVGDAIVYQYNASTDFAAHVNLVVAVRGDGMIQTIGGNQGASPGQVRLDDWHRPENYMPGNLTIVMPVGVTNGPPAAGPGSAQAMIVGLDDHLYHEVRFPDGTWTGFAGIPGNAKAISVAGMKDGSAQVVMVGSDNRVYHQVRYKDGNWSGFAGLPGIGTTEAAGAKAASITGLPNGSAQVLIVGLDDKVYHEVRFSDGNWSGFAPLPGIGTTEAASAKAVSIAGMSDGSAQVLIIGMDDRLYHEIRYADGNWTGFASLGAYAKAVSIAGLPDNSAQVVIVSLADQVYHQVRYANATWSGFNGLPGIGTTDAAGAKDVSIAGFPNGSSQVLMVGTDDRVYHEVRFADGNWSGFNGLPGIGTSDAAGAKKVAIAGMP